MFIKQSEKILIGVSGGPDSMYLLNDLVEQGYTNIYVCHVNYNYREDSHIDQKIVEDFCNKNNLHFDLKVISDSTYDDNEIGNFESFARDERYNFFLEVANKNNIKYAFIAHNMNDVIETYLLQKNRGSIVNWYGLKILSDYKGLQIVRPLLNKKKSEILESNKLKDVPYAIDSTNFNLDYARNKIRSEIKESDFPTYLEQIKKDNEANEKLKREAEFYANNNLTATSMKLTDKFYSFEIDQIMFVLIKYLKLIDKDDKFMNRSNNTLREIAEMLKTTTKKFVKVQVNDYYFVKDYDMVYFVNENWFDFKTIEIDSKEDLDKLKVFQEWVNLEQTITKDGYDFPYMVSNDYELYKTKTFVNKKKANRYFIDKKIPYEVRYKKPVVINLNTNEILNIKR